MKSISKLLFTVFFALILLPDAEATGFVTLKSSNKQISLLELYSSEGCDSCPPAEAWISELKNSSGLWSEFVPLVFHVDYWDYLGWSDPFADKRYTERQRTLGHGETIYTPEFFLNGVEWRDRKAGAPKLGATTPGVLTATQTSPTDFTMTFQAKDSSQKYVFNAVRLQMNQAVKVTRGENANKTLAHDFIVTEWISGTAKIHFAKAPQAVAFWVSSSNGLPVQAVGGKL